MSMMFQHQRLYFRSLPVCHILYLERVILITKWTTALCVCVSRFLFISKRTDMTVSTVNRQLIMLTRVVHIQPSTIAHNRRM